MVSRYSSSEAETVERNHYVLGIDLGSTKICTTVIRRGKVEVIPDGGHNTTPAQVAFTSRGRLVGTAAARQAHLNLENTISIAAHFLGQDIDSDGFQDLILSLPFDIVSARKKLYFRVQYQNQDLCITPQEVLAMLLDHVKKNAEKYLDGKIEGAVIVVPSTYDKLQRQLIVSAASAAGIHTFRLIQGSTSCAIARHFSHHSRHSRKIMVIDIASRATTATLFDINGDNLDIKSTATDTSVGGEHFTNHLAAYVLKHASDHIDPANLEDNIKMNKFWKECEAAKCQLTQNDYSDIEYGFLIGDMELQYVLTPAWLEQICGALSHKILNPINKALCKSGTRKAEVDEVIIVGGSSKIPALRNIISTFFGRDILNCVEPCQYAAYGAAIQAAYLTNQWLDDAPSERLTLRDTLPRSLGIRSDDGEFVKVLHDGSSLPCRGQFVISTHANFARDFEIPILEGGTDDTMQNRLLGTVKIPIAFEWKTKARIVLTFEVSSADGLSVRAVQMGKAGAQVINSSMYDSTTTDDVVRMTKKLDYFQTKNRPESLELSASGSPRKPTCSPRKLLLSDPERYTIRQKTEVIETTIEWVRALPAKEERDHRMHLFTPPATPLSSARNSVALSPTDSVLCRSAKFDLATGHLIGFIKYYLTILPTLRSKKGLRSLVSWLLGFFRRATVRR